MMMMMIIIIINISITIISGSGISSSSCSSTIVRIINLLWSIILQLITWMYVSSFWCNIHDLFTLHLFVTYTWQHQISTKTELLLPWEPC